MTMTTLLGHRRPRADPADVALEPVRAALRDAATAGAVAANEAAAADGQAALAAARAEAETVLAAARAQGEHDAAMAHAADLVGARREARRLVLAAERDGYDELHAAVCRVVADRLAEDPELRDRLAAAAIERLGPGTVVRTHPEGGIVAEAPDGRRILASAAALTDRALAATDVEALWAP